MPPPSKGETNAYMMDVWDFSEDDGTKSVQKGSVETVAAMNTKIFESSPKISGDTNEEALEAEKAAYWVSRSFLGNFKKNNEQ